MPKKIDNYIQERQDVLNKLLNILEITKENNMLSLKKLDESEEKKNKITELVEDVKKYFICSKWNYFINKKKPDFKRTYLSLIKAIMKDMNITMTASFLHIKSDDKTKYQTFYIFNLN